MSSARTSSCVTDGSIVWCQITLKPFWLVPSSKSMPEQSSSASTKNCRRPPSGRRSQPSKSARLSWASSMSLTPLPVVGYARSAGQYGRPPNLVSVRVGLRPSLILSLNSDVVVLSLMSSASSSIRSLGMSGAELVVSCVVMDGSSCFRCGHARAMRGMRQA